MDGELSDAARRLAGVQHALRVAAADPYVPEADPDKAMVLRIGFGSGEQAAEGRYAAAWLPRGVRRRAKRSMEAPEERFAAILGARERVLACEALVLEARGPRRRPHARSGAAGQGGARGAAGGAARHRPGRRARRRGRRRQRRHSRRPAGGRRRRPVEAVQGMETALKRRRLGA